MQSIHKVLHKYYKTCFASLVIKSYSNILIYIFKKKTLNKLVFFYFKKSNYSKEKKGQINKTSALNMNNVKSVEQLRVLNVKSVQ